MVELGGKNLWKAVRLAQNKPIGGLPEEIKLPDGTRVKDDFDKAKGFSKYFEGKTKKIIASTNIDGEEVYNGKRKI